MTIEIKYYNYNINNNDNLIIEYPEVNYEYWKRTKDYNDDTDLSNILDIILKDLDCTRKLGDQHLTSTIYPKYKMTLTKYYYYLIKLNDQFLYNKYLDKLINLHNYNIIYEKCLSNKPKEIKSPIKKKPRSNKFRRYISHDLFTNEEVYFYINEKTGEEIRSSNPNLLDELNNKKKVKQTKQNSISLDAMTFSFKK